jgi:hypothetical protein
LLISFAERLLEVKTITKEQIAEIYTCESEMKNECEYDE